MLTSEYANKSADIKVMNNFDRHIELSDGLETDYVRLLYYEFDHYYKDFYKSYEYYRLCTILNGSKHIEVNNKENFIYNKDEYVVLPASVCGINGNFRSHQMPCI